MPLPQFLRSISNRLANREDSEHVQAFVRIALTFGTLMMMLVADPSRNPSIAHFYLGRSLVLGSLIVSLGLLAAILANPAPSIPRRGFAIVHDVALLSAALYLAEGVLASYAALYLIVAVANGFRFGTPYLYVTTAMAALGFTVVYLTSDYWKSQTTLSVNIFVMLAVVPIYVGQLLRSLHHARDQLRYQATTDPLTGLLNRAEFERRIETLLESEPNGHYLLFCDLDRFKSVNDIAGHAAGDKLLADLASLIEGTARPTDICARPGGDEFCILLTHCDSDRARDVAEQIREHVSGYRLAWAKRYFSVGISIGAAPSSAVTDMKSLFRLADAACYAAKNAGRNQIHVIDPHVDEVDTVNVRRLYLANDEDAAPARRRP